jgi:hypothetical protein
MNSILRSIIVTIVTLAVSVAFAQDPKSPPELIKLREDYLRRQESLLQPLKVWYRQELQRLEQAAIQRRDAEAALALKQEREAIGIPTVGKPTFTVIKAIYGSGDQTADVTKEIKAFVNNNALRLKAPWGLRIDPAFSKVKELKIRYSHAGTEKNATFNQDEDISLP